MCVRSIFYSIDSANERLVQEIVILVFHRCLYNKHLEIRHLSSLVEKYFTHSLRSLVKYFFNTRRLLSERLCNLFQLDSGLYNLRKREFVQPRFSSVTYGKHSLRYLGPKLWNDLTPRLRNLPSLKQFKNVIRDRDLTALAANVSDCRGCNLCQE